LPKEGTENLFPGLLLEPRFLNFAASRFFILGLRFWGPWTLWGPALFGSRAKTGNKKTVWSPALWGLNFGVDVF
jgi:hypothetical protein